MKWAESDSCGCKQHPNDKQQPGVCSSCLRDKLSKLYVDSGDKRSASPPPSPQPLPSAASSPYASAAYRRRHRRNASDVLDSVSSIFSFNYGLKRSRSIALASRSRLRGHGDVTGINWGRKKNGFWSKLLKFTKFMHSDTTREANS